MFRSYGTHECLGVKIPKTFQFLFILIISNFYAEFWLGNSWNFWQRCSLWREKWKIFGGDHGEKKKPVTEAIHYGGKTMALTDASCFGGKMMALTDASVFGGEMIALSGASSFGGKNDGFDGRKSFWWRLENAARKPLGLVRI